MEKVKQKFSAWSLKLNYWSPRHQTSVSKAWISFKCSKFLTTIKNTQQVYSVERKLRNFTGRLNSKNFCNMHIMQELPTIKTNFLFENSQDFNQTTHGRPQYSIFFIHNIIIPFSLFIILVYILSVLVL